MNLNNGIMFLLSLLVKAVQLRVERELSLGAGWNANETGEFVKVVPDYNETQMWSRPVWIKCPVCRSTLHCWHCDPEAITKDDTQMTLIEVCDLDGERGSVSIAVRRLKRIRCYDAIWSWSNNLRSLGRKCDDSVSKATEQAIDNLSRYGALIRAEGVKEQQEIFETQMIRMGEHDDTIEDWRVDFEQWGSFAEQTRSMSRFGGHQRGW